MRLKIALILILFLNVSMSFAKNDKLPPGPFQIGSSLQVLSSIQIESAEISAFMPAKKMLFVVGGEKNLEIVDLKNPAEPKSIGRVKLPGDASSVTVYENLIAVSLLNDPEWEIGHVQVMRYDDSLEVLSLHEVCHMPDMITFTPDGKNLLLACEGSPSEDFSKDFEGGIAVFSISDKPTPEAWKNPKKTVVGFETLDSTALLNVGVRKTGVKSFWQSLEPEYITVSENSKIAWISLQENNALVKFDVQSKKILSVFPLGFVDHSKPGFGLDIVDNKKIEIKNYPLRGLRQPDGIAAFQVNGKNFVMTANEGAAVNDYEAWTDITTPAELAKQNRLDTSVFNQGLLDELNEISVSNLERCDVAPNVTPSGKCPFMYTFGTRSVSIFEGENGQLIWDSGEMFEQAFAKMAPDYFNWNSKKDKIKMDSRSDKSGCEPENVTTGMVGKKLYAFVGLERTSSIAMLDLMDVKKPKLVDMYFDPKYRGPEGLLFIPAEKSPLKGQALLVVGFEYNKTLVVYKVK